MRLQEYIRTWGYGEDKGERSPDGKAGIQYWRFAAVMKCFEGGMGSLRALAIGPGAGMLSYNHSFSVAWSKVAMS